MMLLARPLPFVLCLFENVSGLWLDYLCIMGGLDVGPIASEDFYWLTMMMMMIRGRIGDLHRNGQARYYGASYGHSMGHQEY